MCDLSKVELERLRREMVGRSILSGDGLAARQRWSADSHMCDPFARGRAYGNFGPRYSVCMAGMPALRGDRIGLYAPVKSHCMRSCTLLERSVPPVSYEGGAGGGGGDTDGPLLVEPVGPPSTTETPIAVP